MLTADCQTNGRSVPKQGMFFLSGHAIHVHLISCIHRIGIRMNDVSGREALICKRNTLNVNTLGGICWEKIFVVVYYNLVLNKSMVNFARMNHAILVFIYVFCRKS